MTDEKYIVQDFDHCLGHLIEECGEVLAAAGKTLRWGWMSTNPELPSKTCSVCGEKQYLTGVSLCQSGAKDHFTVCACDRAVQKKAAEIEQLKKAATLI